MFDDGLNKTELKIGGCKEWVLRIFQRSENFGIFPNHSEICFLPYCFTDDYEILSALFGTERARGGKCLMLLLRIFDFYHSEIQRIINIFLSHAEQKGEWGGKGEGREKEKGEEERIGKSSYLCSIMKNIRNFL